MLLICHLLYQFFSIKKAFEMQQNCSQNRPRMQEMVFRVSKFSGGACPRTPLAYSPAALGRFTRKRVNMNKCQNVGPPQYFKPSYAYETYPNSVFDILKLIPLFTGVQDTRPKDNSDQTTRTNKISTTRPNS